MTDLVAEIAKTIADEAERQIVARFAHELDRFARSHIQVCFSEAEAAAKLGLEKTTLAAIRRRGEINYYSTGKSATYGLHHLQDFLSRREVLQFPQRFEVKNEVSLLGVETETKLRKVS